MPLTWLIGFTFHSGILFDEKRLFGMWTCQFANYNKAALTSFCLQRKNIGYRLISKSKCNVTVVEEVMILSLT